MPTVRIVGPGRAGSSLADALTGAGWTVLAPVNRGDDPAGAARDADVCVIATPDDLIEATARAVTPDPTTLVVHLSGSLGLEVLAPHARRGSLHPLASLPDRETGARVLRQPTTWWAVDGDPAVKQIVEDLGGRTISPTDRVAYHAAACIAANHVVVLMAQVERVANLAGVPAEPFYDLAAQALANARANGARAALTGPAVRGDTGTLDRHRAALPIGERPLYDAVAHDAVAHAADAVAHDAVAHAARAAVAHEAAAW